MNKIIITACTVVFVGFVLFQVVPGQEHSQIKNNPIKIGASTSLTGVAAGFGEMAKMGMELAVESINMSGGINGRLVELYIEDDKTSAKDAVSAYRKLVGVDGVEAVVGSQFDFVTQPLLPLALSHKITTVSPSNMVMDDAFEMNEQTFVMYPPFEEIIDDLEGVVSSNNVQKLGMIRFQSEFSAEIEETLGEIMEGLGRDSHIHSQVYLEIGGSDFRTPALKLKEQGVDAVFLDTLDFDTIKFLNRAREINYKPLFITHSTGRDVLSNSDVNPDLVEGLVMLDWEISSDEFTKLFEEVYGLKPRKSANKAYDAVYMLADAIAHTDNPSEVAEYLENNTFSTINGEFSFTDEHALKQTPVEIHEVRGGKFVRIK